MTEEASNRSREMINLLVGELTDDQRQALLAWAEEMRLVQQSGLSITQKVKKVVGSTKKHGVILIVSKRFASTAKRFGWDQRSWPARLGISGVMLALLLFGTAAGGFAAFGTAVAVPLWLVFGAGGLILGQLIDALRKNRSDGA